MQTTLTYLYSIFLSELFTFVVGPECKAIPVHSGAISQLSPALNAMINSLFKEAETRVVKWEDVEVDVFTRLCQIAYTEDYSSPQLNEIKPTPQLEETNPTLPDWAEAIDDIDLSPQPEGQITNE